MASFELSGSVSAADKVFIETWENVSPGTNYVIRENRRGDEEYVEVAGYRSFKLSTYDRMLTEDKINDVQDNPFKNGAFRPVTVPADVTIESNPNAMSASDIARLFGASDAAWGEWMGVINSPATLQRMLDLADSGEVELSHRRYRQLADMQVSHTSRGKPVLAQKDRAEYEQLDGSGSEPVAEWRGLPPKSASV